MSCEPLPQERWHYIPVCLDSVIRITVSLFPEVASIDAPNRYQLRQRFRCGSRSRGAVIVAQLRQSTHGDFHVRAVGLLSSYEVGVAVSLCLSANMLL